MSIEIAALGAGAAVGGAGGAGVAGIASPTPVGYGASLADVGAFERTLARLDAAPVQGPSESVRALMRPFDAIDGEATKLSADAQAARASGHDLTPGEMVHLTVRAQEFMFHCQLVSNVANRTSDGLQQLFRQQS